MKYQGKYAKIENCEHIPIQSRMFYKHESRSQTLLVIFCQSCGETLRNFSWPERDQELIKKLEKKYTLA